MDSCKALKPSARKKRARAAGATEQELEEADDAEDPNAAFIELILSYEDARSGDDEEPSSAPPSEIQLPPVSTGKESVPAELILDCRLPETDVGRQALESEIIADLARQMGVDPKRIKITALEEQADTP